MQRRVIVPTWQRGAFGKTNVEEMPVPSASHRDAVLSAAFGQLAWFEEILKTPVAPPPSSVKGLQAHARKPGRASAPAAHAACGEAPWSSTLTSPWSRKSKPVRKARNGAVARAVERWPHSPWCREAPGTSHHRPLVTGHALIEVPLTVLSLGHSHVLGQMNP